MTLACTVAFTTITPAFATEAETTKLDEIEETIELEPSAQSIDTENELEEVVKNWVAKNPEYEKEVELYKPYAVGRRDIFADSAIKFTIAKNNGRYVAYATGEDRIAANTGGVAGVNYLWFIIPHNGYYVHDFDEEGYHFYEDRLPARKNSEYEKP